MKNQAPFAFAGLWEFWSGAGNSAIESCTIITTEPNELLSEVHDRMPVILHESDYDLWLDTDEASSEEVQSLLVPYPGEQMVFFRISTHVNNPRHEDAACVEPVE
jgi:putative SOS response-associated peptidase YedK